VSESTIGFDCGGLVQYAVYQATGGAVLMPHEENGAYQRFSSPDVSEEPVGNESAWQVGDVLVFADGNHVGIYVGGGRMIDADTSYYKREDGVQEEPVSWVTSDSEYPLTRVLRVSGGGGGGGVSEGEFVSYQGNVYRIAGGAPIYVSNWSAFGGSQPTTALSEQQWDALRQYPASGTGLCGQKAGGVGWAEVVAGGAPIYITSFSNVSPSSCIPVDQVTLEHPGSGPPYNHLRQYPESGTGLCGQKAGGVGWAEVVAGGAPIYITSFSNVSPSPCVPVDQVTLEHPGGEPPFDDLKQYPENGTGLCGQKAGGVGGAFVVAGGAPIYITSFSNIDPEPCVPVDQVTLEHAGGEPPFSNLRQYPASGTFLTGQPGGAIYRVAGASPLAVTSCEPLGGCQGAVTVDQSAIDFAGESEFLGHLVSQPLSGTVIEGMPSQSFWLIQNGRRKHAAASAGAVQVNDATAESFPQIEPAATTAAATALSPVEVSLAGSVDPEGELVSGCWFEYGSTVAYGSSAPCSPSPGEGEAAVAVSAVVGGLVPGTGYHFRVVAVGPGGTSDGADGTFVTASLAAPELGRCVKVAGEKAGSKTVYHGGFTSSNCEVVSVSRSGKYEWEPGVVKAGVALSGGATTLETVGGAKLTCTGVSGAGSYAAVTRIVGLMLHFTGCEQAGVKCSSSGSGAGEIASPALEGLLGIESKAKKKLALEVSPADKSGPLLQYACGANTTSVSGAVLVPVAAGKMAASGSLKFSASKGKQKPEALEGASKTVLEAAVNGGTPEQVGLTSKITLTNEETLENNPTV
jgi:hypothetical protein